MENLINRILLSVVEESVSGTPITTCPRRRLNRPLKIETHRKEVIYLMRRWLS
jgi:hypothetical protein